MSQSLTQPHPLRWFVLFGVWSIYATFGLIVSSLAPVVERLESDLDMSHAAMGSVMGAWQLVFVAAAIPCGFLLDRIGSRWALFLGAFCIGASAYLRSYAGDYWELLVAVMLFGVGGPIVSAGAPKTITSWFDGAERGFAMGIYVTGPALGGVAALTLTHGWLMPMFDGDWRPVFRLWAYFAFGAGVLWWCIASIPDIRRHSCGEEVQRALPYRKVISLLIAEPAVRVVLLMSVGVFMVSHGMMNWLPALLMGHGMTAIAAGYWAAVPTLVGVFSALLIPRLATPDRRFLILAGLCLALVIATCLLHFESRFLLTLGMIFQGVARATLMTVLVLTLVELPGIGHRNAGTASGLFFSAAEFGGMLGPPTVGILYDLSGGFGSGLVLFTCVALSLVWGTARLYRMSERA
jgi:CP family cyanate transporter-like MFS transporter